MTFVCKLPCVSPVVCAGSGIPTISEPGSLASPSWCKYSFILLLRNDTLSVVRLTCRQERERERGWEGERGRGRERWGKREGERNRDRETEKMEERQTDRQTNTQAGRQADRQRHRETHRETERDRDTDRQTNRDRQTDHVVCPISESSSSYLLHQGFVRD